MNFTYGIIDWAIFTASCYHGCPKLNVSKTIMTPNEHDYTYDGEGFQNASINIS